MSSNLIEATTSVEQTRAPQQLSFFFFVEELYPRTQRNLRTRIQAFTTPTQMGDGQKKCTAQGTNRQPRNIQTKHTDSNRPSIFHPAFRMNEYTTSPPTRQGVKHWDSWFCWVCFAEEASRKRHSTACNNTITHTHWHTISNQKNLDRELTLVGRITVLGPEKQTACIRGRKEALGVDGAARQDVLTGTTCGHAIMAGIDTPKLNEFSNVSHRCLKCVRVCVCEGPGGREHWVDIIQCNKNEATHRAEP